jgi:hypothetical protein
LRALFRRGRTSILIGLIFLAECLAGRELAASVGILVFRILAESLTIAGWVAMWESQRVYFDEWWTLRDTRLMEKLARMPVRFVPHPGPGTPAVRPGATPDRNSSTRNRCQFDAKAWLQQNAFCMDRPRPWSNPRQRFLGRQPSF